MGLISHQRTHIDSSTDIETHTIEKESFLLCLPFCHQVPNLQCLLSNSSSLLVLFVFRPFIVVTSCPVRYHSPPEMGMTKRYHHFCLHSCWMSIKNDIGMFCKPVTEGTQKAIHLFSCIMLIDTICPPCNLIALIVRTILMKLLHFSANVNTCLFIHSSTLKVILWEHSDAHHDTF